MSADELLGKGRRLRVPQEWDGKRLYQVLGELVPGISRARLVKLLRRRDLRVRWRGLACKRADVRLAAGDELEIALGRAPASVAPVALAIRPVYLDDDLLVIDKPAGLASHPNERHRHSTVADQAEQRYGPLARGMGALRPGVVHRLDRETSGLMVLARTEAAMSALRREFRERSVDKRYLAFVLGEPEHDEGRIDAPLGADPGHADRQCARAGGAPATTLYRVELRLGAFAVVECRPLSGRRHQVRAHLASIGHPLLGDRLYLAEHTGLAGSTDPSLALARHALHARSLACRHPRTGARLEFHSALPADLAGLLAARGVDYTPSSSPSVVSTSSVSV